MKDFENFGEIFLRIWKVLDLDAKTSNFSLNPIKKGGGAEKKDDREGGSANILVSQVGAAVLFLS